ncbi:MAG: rhodanese-like domain-containing protein [Pseudomonadota bacterium]
MGIKELAEQAQTEIRSISVQEALADESGALVYVDVRDIRELERDGTIEGAHHAPRGMIEFWFDPDSPYFRDVYGDPDKTYVLFCNAEWRSALSAKSLQDMGIGNVAQLFGGLPAWREAGGGVREKPRKS